MQKTICFTHSPWARKHKMMAVASVGIWRCLQGSYTQNVHQTDVGS